MRSGCCGVGLVSTFVAPGFRTVTFTVSSVEPSPGFSLPPGFSPSPGFPPSSGLFPSPGFSSPPRFSSPVPGFPGCSVPFPSSGFTVVSGEQSPAMAMNAARKSVAICLVFILLRCCFPNIYVAPVAAFCKMSDNSTKLRIFIDNLKKRIKLKILGVKD